MWKRAYQEKQEILSIGHPFMDGNKRTAFEVTDILLRGNGYHIHAAEGEILHALLKIAKYECTVEEIEKWLRKKVRSLELG